MNMVRFKLTGIAAVMVLSGAVTLLAFLACPPPALSAEPDCLSCHEDLKKAKHIHQALEMGCATCHAELDASDLPHKSKGKAPKGLSAEQPELCYTCHNKSKFVMKNVHAAVTMGCGSCHNPHASKNAKLLLNGEPNLCYTCHDKAEFMRKNVHTAVGMGCSSCHASHASESTALLKKEPLALCLECHAEVKTKPHAITGFGTKTGHPLGQPSREGKIPMDPARPGKQFYCGSCHVPHSSDHPKLFRFNAASAFDLCMNCHKK